MTDHPTTLLRTLRQATACSDEPTPDNELLRRFVEHRDEAAFTALVRRYAPMVLGVGLRTLHHRQDAEDVCQATFLTLSQKAAAVGWRASVAGWLYDVARRHAQNARSATQRRSAPANRLANTPCPDAATEAAVRELQTALDEELGRLPQKYRTPLVLCCLEGMTRDEAAQFLGLSLPAVKSRLEEGRERLRRRLTRRGLELPAVLAGYTLLSAGTAHAGISALVRTVTHLAVGDRMGAVPEPVAGLVAQGVPKMSSNGFGVLAGVLLATGAVAAGLVDTPSAEPPSRPSADSKAIAEPQPRIDRHGDALPDGTVLRFGTTRLRHANVYSLAFNSDGQLTSFGRDYVVKVWDPATGRLVRERAFEREQIHRFWGGRLSPDGRRVAVQRLDRMKVFDVGSGKELASVKLGSSWEAMARFSPDGKVLAVVDQDDKQTTHRLQLCDVGADNCRELAQLGGFSSEPVFSRDGKRLAAPEGSNGVRVWDLASGRELLRFQSAGLLGGTVDFDPTGDVLVVLGAINPPQAFHLVRVSTGKAPDGWTAPAVADFEWVRFSPDGSSVLLGGRKSLVCCEAKTGKKQFAAEGWAATPAAFSPDGKLVASARPSAIRLWNLASGKSAVPEELRGTPEEEISGVAVSPDGKWMATKDGDTGTVRVWDSDGRAKGTMAANRWGGRYPLFAPDGKHLFGVAPDAIALVRWEFPGGKETARYTFAEPAADQVHVYHYGLSADGKRLAAVTQTATRPGAPGGGGAGGGARRNETATLTVWDAATGTRLESREVSGRGYIGYGAFAPDLRWYFTGDRALALGAAPEFQLEMPPWYVSARQAATSADGRLVAQLIDTRMNADLVSRVTIHETATGKPILTLPTGYCGPIAFTPDARGLVVTDAADITRWDLSTRKVAVRHKAPGRFSGSYGGAFASSLVVTPDGTRAVTGQNDTTALVWDLGIPPRRALELTEADLAAAWTDLGAGDAEKGYAAVWTLADAGAVVVPFLAARLEPVAAPAEERVRKLIGQLGAEKGADRDAADRELRTFGDAIAPALRAAAKGATPGEQLRRLDALIAAADDPILGAGDRLRAVRAVAVLESVATKEARASLGRLAKGAPDARLTREAGNARKRLGE
jgi:RNA polymerase sigma factor (sigma-70 family)